MKLEMILLEAVGLTREIEDGISIKKSETNSNGYIECNHISFRFNRRKSGFGPRFINSYPKRILIYVQMSLVRLVDLYNW